MPKSLSLALALIACAAAGNAFAQSPDYGDDAGSEPPTLILPNTLTSPMTSGLGSDGYGAIGAPEQNWSTDAPPEVPYSVEGEEQLEPETN